MQAMQRNVTVTGAGDRIGRGSATKFVQLGDRITCSITTKTS
jgi:NAD(P)-dependent dehydrogenase (short-subunit alcohol dehydrogenase family)